MASKQVFTDIILKAWLAGAWYDLTTDIQQPASISWGWGIRGYKATDILAGVGNLSFTLRNDAGLYYPDGPSGLAGWRRFAPILLELKYQGQTYRYRYYINKISPKVGNVAAESTVAVTCVDWLYFASERPILTPSIIANVTADEALTVLVDAMPIQPQARDFKTGAITFLSVFDNVSTKTMAYGEMAKIANSEWAYCYLRKDNIYGETLVLENAGYRGLQHPLGTIGQATTAVQDKHLLESGDYHLLESGDKVLLETSYTITKDFVTIEPETGTYDENSIIFDSIDIEPGALLTNRFTNEAIPRRVDQETVTLYSLGKPIPIAAGQTLETFRARYTDPQGGNRVNGFDFINPPEVPGAPDPYLVNLMHFNDGDTMTDSTGKNTWTAQNNDMTVNDVYVDAGGNQYVSGNIVGPYAIFGGYAPYWISCPTTPGGNFDFGAGAYSITWKEVRINPVAGAATMARNGDAAKPQYLLGMSDGENLLVYMSNNGSSWNIADGRSMGKIQRGRWVDYLVCGDGTGWHWIFADGQMTDTWYSPNTFVNSSALFSVGRTQGSVYTYMAFDEFAVYKGLCLHKTNFTPLAIERKTTLLGDYQVNTLENNAGTDLSADLAITASYGSEAASFSLTNNSASDGFITYLTVRGRGVYQYNPIEGAAEDTTSQNNYGYQNLSIRQPYQQSVDAGKAKAAAIVSYEKDERTNLLRVGFVANKTTANMNLFLQSDIGTLYPIKIPLLGINGSYYINDIQARLSKGEILTYSFGLREDYARYPTASLFYDEFISATYTWAATGGMSAVLMPGTVSNPGQVELTFDAQDAEYRATGGYTAFTWADIDSFSASAFFTSPNSANYKIFIGLTAGTPARTSARIGFYKDQLTVYATGCDSTPGNAWTESVYVHSGAAPRGETLTFYFRRISATSAAFSVNGGAEQTFTGALPANGDTLRPVFAMFDTASSAKTARLNSITITTPA